MDLRRIRDTLLGIGVPVFHFTALEQAAPYLVWGEDGQGDTVSADNCLCNRAVQGTVDLFTTQELDPLADKVETALEECGAAWRLNSIQYEEDTGLIHYEWVWEIG